MTTTNTTPIQQPAEAMKIINPMDWHRKPPRKHHCQCPYCGAPGRIASSHRRLPGEEGQKPRYAFLRRVGKQYVEILYETHKGGNQKGIRHKYPRRCDRKPITPKVLRRIAKATRLLASGLTWKQVETKLGLSESKMLDYYARHRELWNASIEKASKDSAEKLKMMAGTPEIFENNGKLVRVAKAAAEQHGEPLFFPIDRGDGKQTLSQFVENVYIPSRIQISSQYTKKIRMHIARLNAFLGKEAIVDELNEADLCRYLAAMRKVYGAVTVNKTRQVFLTLWKNAYDYELCERPPRLGLVRRCPEESEPPDAWTAEECNRLFSAAANLDGFVCGIPAGKWWVSLLFSIYWSACRISAILGTPTSAYDGAGILVNKQKNHKSQWYSLPESCCRAIDETKPRERKMLWPWELSKDAIWPQMREIVVSAGISQPPGGRQLFHRLRRTTLSLCASIDPSIAQRQAGHANYATTLKHYIDPRIARGRSAADVLPEPIITTLPHESAEKALSPNRKDCIQ